MKSRLEIELVQNRMLSLHGDAQKLLRRYPNVDHVGVGIKEKNGRLTDELSFRVYVHQKKSQSALRPSEIIPPMVMGYRTDVLVKDDVVLHAADMGNYRPLRGGISIANEFNPYNALIPGLYGTMGCLARVTAGNKMVGLSAMHVLEESLPIPMIPEGVAIGQPGQVAIMLFTTNTVGTVTTGSYTGGLDCGIFEIESSLATDIQNGGSEYLVQDIGNLTGVAQAVCYEVVRKRGAATRLTSGVVVDVRYSGTNLLINPCTDFVNFSEPGDSGAVIVNSADKVVGLLIGSARGNATQGVGNHIKPVLTALGITIAGQGAATAGLVGVPAAACAPGGVTVCFGGSSPTIQQSKDYFRALDDGTLFLHRQPAYIAEAAGGPLHLRREAIFTGARSMRNVLAPYVFRDPNGWEERAKTNNIAVPLDVVPAADPTRPTALVDAPLHANIVMLSTYQLALLSTHFPGTTGAGSIDYDKVRITFERFMNGELRERAATPGVHPYGPAQLLSDGAREPNGSFEMMFAAFAWLCVESRIEVTKWQKLFNIYVQCQELFMYVYRWRPQVAPPATGSLPVPPHGGAAHSLNPSSADVTGATFGVQGFSFDHFNLGPLSDTLAMRNARLDASTSIAQSMGARKAWLRAKYEPMTYDQTKVAMKENIIRMLYWP